ncbi:hypothetical protein [Sinimarinibacterium sp. NLF-5-8]|uniref:hypothetical protein n=1 Tax=Sinimarinibacterium sp. NLF-5-8 TaxID=2698684 RepID=UPI00137BECE4|nr:hypothetical protein [Sinimarinibacterium sp. NLF-5-8]QHS10630.1 hypothetical protein GT972_11110 [Sinimarinibacterium sp. NLF-5-8]
MDSFLQLPAVRLALIASGGFYLCGLLTGVWKYVHMARHPQAHSPVYVDIAHRSSLMYAFATLLVATMAALSAWRDAVNYWAVLSQVSFFALAIGSYVLHGLLRDTDNQFERPHRIARWPLPRHALLVLMLLLMAGEIGGFLVLFSGVLKRLCG